MRTVAVLIASTQICLVACQPAPGSLLPPPGPEAAIKLASTPTPAPNDAQQPPLKAPAPYMRCVNDFWGNCTGVVSSRHQYRWRYVRPGARPKEMRESVTARANSEESSFPLLQKAVLSISPPAQDSKTVKSGPEPAEKAPPSERPARKAKPAREAQPREAAARETPPRQKSIAAQDGTIACHPRRRVVGDERPSQDDARRAAEDGWMGAIRYDYGERYQDINKAKDVRLNCGPSSVSKALKTPYFRCAVEATPCRQLKGVPTEPDERRYEEHPPEESQISRR